MFIQSDDNSSFRKYNVIPTFLGMVSFGFMICFIFEDDLYIFRSFAFLDFSTKAKFASFIEYVTNLYLIHFFYLFEVQKQHYYDQEQLEGCTSLTRASKFFVAR